MNNKQTRYFKLLTDGGYAGHCCIGDVYELYSFEGNLARLIVPSYSYTNPLSFMVGSEAEEVFDYTPNQEFSRTDCGMNGQSKQIFGENKRDEKVVDDNGVKCIYRDGIREFETGAVRSDNRGRERYDLIPQFALDMAAEVFGKNCGEFGSGNHMKCLPEKVCVESLLRHMASLNRWMQGVGELNEEDVASMVNNVMMLAHTVRAKRLGFYNKKHNW